MSPFVLKRNMFCTHCGTKIESGSVSCPHCGEAQTIKNKTRFPFWLRLLIGVGLIGFLVALVLFLSESDPSKVVEDQLKALGSNQLTEAYYGYTSSQFQQSTSLEKFKEYVQAFPLLTQVNQVDVLTTKEEGDVAFLKTILTSDTLDRFEADYNLIKDEGGWKIVSFKLSALDELSDQPLLSDPLIDKFQNALRQNNIEKGWKEDTTEEFQAATPLADFKTFVATYPILTHFNSAKPTSIKQIENAKRITYILEGDDTDEAVEYILSKEQRGWKIHGLKLILTHPQDLKNTTTFTKSSSIPSKTKTTH